MGAIDFAEYWEQRALRFARQGRGLAAVCSYGMPEFYNLAIHASQRIALRRGLRPRRGASVLDVGCGIGRWSCLLAARGAQVNGIDLSPTMVAEAQRRSADLGLEATFLQADLACFDLGRRYEQVLGVTVLQHILTQEAFEAAVRNLARHLAVGGRMVLLEAAPTRRQGRCDTAVFTARGMDEYLCAFRGAGLEVEAVTGVDPAPFKTWLLPHYRSLPWPLAQALLLIATVFAVPIDALLGRRLVGLSWHKVFVLRHAATAPA